MQAQHPSNKSTQTAGLPPKSGFQEMQPQQPLQGLAPGCPLGHPSCPPPRGLSLLHGDPQRLGVSQLRPQAGRQYSPGTAVALTVTPFPQTIRTLQDANFSSAGSRWAGRELKRGRVRLAFPGDSRQNPKKETKPQRKHPVWPRLESAAVHT